MMDDMIIGPVILDDTLTGERYLHFLQNELPALLKDVSLHSRCRMYMQHDGAAIHYTGPVVQHLMQCTPACGLVEVASFVGQHDPQT